MITAIHFPIGEKIASLTKIGLIGFSFVLVFMHLSMRNMP